MWAHPGTVQIVLGTPIISGTGKATQFKFCRNIHWVDRNKTPRKKWGIVAVGVVRESRKFLGHPRIGRIAGSSLRLHSFHMKFLTDFTYRNLHGFARFPGDITALVFHARILSFTCETKRTFCPFCLRNGGRPPAPTSPGLVLDCTCTGTVMTRFLRKLANENLYSSRTVDTKEKLMLWGSSGDGNKCCGSGTPTRFKK